jgi:hypothetical protein
MLNIKPITLRDANAFVRDHHRHLSQVAGCRFCLKLIDHKGLTRGVLIAGRPVSRNLDDGLTIEVTRVATDGVKNGCSKFYGATARIAALMGFEKIITYTLEIEVGASLKAVGWKPTHGLGGGLWVRNGRLRTSNVNTGKKTRWEKQLT